MWALQGQGLPPTPAPRVRGPELTPEGVTSISDSAGAEFNLNSLEQIKSEIQLLSHTSYTSNAQQPHEAHGHPWTVRTRDSRALQKAPGRR